MRITSYTYDNYNRLSNATANAFSRNYQYDEWGNVKNFSGLTLNYATNGSGAPSTNRLLSDSQGGSYTYDAAGNQTAGAGQSYSYDGANRLKEVGTGGANVYGYDGDGKRVKKTEGGSTTYYIYSSKLGQSVMEVSANSVQRAFVYNGGKLVAMQATDGQFYWLHTNHLGNSRAMTDGSGNLTYKGQFDPYGASLTEWSGSGNTNLNNKKFTGYERDNSGLDYAQARMYNSTRGRFLTTDPVKINASRLRRPQRLNLYSYALNDPVNMVDPTGRDGISVSSNMCSLGLIICDSVTINGSNAFSGVDGGGEMVPLDSPTLGLPDKSGSGVQESPEERRRREQREKEQVGINNAAKMLKGDCAKFVRDLIQIAALRRGNTAPNGTLYQLILPNQGGELALNEYIRARNEGRVTASNVSGVEGTKIVYGRTESNSRVIWNNEFYDLSDSDKGFHTLHESLHQIPEFSDALLAEVAKQLTNGPAVGNNDPSLYFNERLREKCQ